jgi:hypothetical protein
VSFSSTNKALGNKFHFDHSSLIHSMACILLGKTIFSCTPFWNGKIGFEGIWAFQFNGLDLNV